MNRSAPGTLAPSRGNDGLSSDGRNVTDQPRPSTVAWWGVVAACLSVLLLLSSSQPPPADAAAALALFAARPRLVALTATIFLSWAVFSIPFVILLGQILQAPSPGLARAATMLSAIGIALLGFAQFAYIGAMLSIIAAGRAPNTGDAIYQAAIWGNLLFFLTDPGLMMWGLGQFLFAWLAWRSRVLPRAVSLVGFISGGAGLLTLAVYQSALLALLQITAFTIWALTAAIVLFRAASSLRRLP
jgi:uncharacterized protein DUF4386